MATQLQIGTIHDRVNSLMHQDRWDHLGGFIYGAIETTQDHEVIAAVIGYTHKVKDKVVDWQDSYQRAWTYLQAAGHDPGSLLPANSGTAE